MAGVRNERQEREFVVSIKDALIRSNGVPITINASCNFLYSVTDAVKIESKNSLGYESYSDVRLTTSNTHVRISMKGTTSPSLGGGGISGIELISPGLGSRFMKLAHSYFIERLSPGDKVPEIYGKISDSDKLKIIMGNELIGGPIEYLYIGPMDIKSEWYHDLLELRINGVLHNSIDFANSNVLYFRLRARRRDQMFDPTSFDLNGIPRIYGRSPSKGDCSGRLVITNKISENAEVIEL